MIKPVTNYQITNNRGSVYEEFLARSTANQQAQATTEHKTTNKRVKNGAMVGSAIGVASATAFVAKRQGYSLNPSKILKTNPKNWALFNIDKNTKVKYETGEILTLGGASIVGGLIGGGVTDKKSNLPAKLRECLSQFVGNIAVPISAIAGAGYLYSQLEVQNGKSIQKIVESKLPQLSKNTKAAKALNTTIKGLPTLGVTIAALGVGIIAGNKVSNFINEKIYKKEVERDIRATDFAPHLDDVCLASSIMAPESKFFSGVARLVPLALSVPGYQVGIAADEA